MLTFRFDASSVSGSHAASLSEVSAFGPVSDTEPFAAADSLMLGIVVTIVTRVIIDAGSSNNNASVMALAMAVVNFNLLMNLIVNLINFMNLMAIKKSLLKSWKVKKAYLIMLKARKAYKLMAAPKKKGARKSAGKKYGYIARVKAWHRIVGELGELVV